MGTSYQNSSPVSNYETLILEWVLKRRLSHFSHMSTRNGYTFQKRRFLIHTRRPAFIRCLQALLRAGRVAVTDDQPLSCGYVAWLNTDSGAPNGRRANALADRRATEPEIVP